MIWAKIANSTPTVIFSQNCNPTVNIVDYICKNEYIVFSHLFENSFTIQADIKAHICIVLACSCSNT